MRKWWSTRILKRAPHAPWWKLGWIDVNCHVLGEIDIPKSPRYNDFHGIGCTTRGPQDCFCLFSWQGPDIWVKLGWLVSTIHIILYYILLYYIYILYILYYILFYYTRLYYIIKCTNQRKRTEGYFCGDQKFNRDPTRGPVFSWGLSQRRKHTLVHRVTTRLDILVICCLGPKCLIFPAAITGRTLGCSG